jgi:predicted Zn-dependent peptidase
VTGGVGVFQVTTDPVLGERVLRARTARGLRIRVAPTDRFRETAAMICFDYGSTDLGFVVDGVRHASPEGVAHYLEHKLFEDEDLHVFERFGRRGATVNAMTGFTRTTYYFGASSEFEENLSDLLHLVSRAHLTPANVDKERGIIAQEIKMYEDSPEYRGFFELLRCLYAEHPVRHPVGGTVASIDAIDVAELAACHRAFYRCGNGALAVAGPVDPERVLAIAEACALPAGDAPPSVCPDDLGEPVRRRATCEMRVARPRVLLGFKERTLVDDVEARLRRELATRILLDRLFGAASEIREGLHRRGLVDDSLSASYMGERSFGFTVVACESDTPDDVIDVLREVLAAPIAIEAEHLERVRRKLLGQYVRSFESVQPIAFGHGEEELSGIDPFRGLARLQSIGLDEVRARQAEHLRDDAFAVAVVAPA